MRVAAGLRDRCDPKARELRERQLLAPYLKDERVVNLLISSLVLASRVGVHSYQGFEACLLGTWRKGASPANSPRALQFIVPSSISRL